MQNKTGGASRLLFCVHRDCQSVVAHISELLFELLDAFDNRLL